MLIPKWDLVRPKNFRPGLPMLSVWRAAVHDDGALKLYPYNADARAVRHRVAGLRFKPEDFTSHTLNAVGEWVDDLPTPGDVTVADSPPQRADFAAAAGAMLTIDSLLEAARKLKAERKAELRASRAAKAKADKEAAASAKAEEARKAISARLHADRCLGEATLALIAEVSRLNNGGAERPADASIAAHCAQLQPLARSYGYRIVKPSMVALVVKL